MSSPRGELTRPVAVGVAGGSGSGKSTVVDRLLAQLNGIAVRRLHHDAYYRDTPDLTPQQRARINYDHPASLETSLLATHLRALLAGESVEVPTYDFTCHRRRKETVRVDPGPIVIVEGILVLAVEELRSLLDIRIFVHTDADVRFIRRLARDTKERNRSVQSVVAQYETTVRPMHLAFVEPSREHAHVIVPWGTQNRVAVDLISARLREAAGSDSPGQGSG